MIYTNPSKPHVEVKVHVSGKYFKLFAPNERGRIVQRGFGSVNKLKEIIGTI